MRLLLLLLDAIKFLHKTRIGDYINVAVDSPDVLSCCCCRRDR